MHAQAGNLIPVLCGVLVIGAILHFSPPWRVPLRSAAVYTGEGAGTLGIAHGPVLLTRMGYRVDTLDANQLSTALSTKYALVWFPGGDSDKMRDALGDSGMQAIRHFVSGGGGYVGFCAG